MQRARDDLLRITEAYNQSKAELDQLKMNPVLRETPQVKAQIAKAQVRYDEARQAGFADTESCEGLPEDRLSEAGWRHFLRQAFFLISDDVGSLGPFQNRIRRSIEHFAGKDQGAHRRCFEHD